MSSNCEGCPFPGRMVEPTEKKRGSLIALIGEGPAEDEWARREYFVGMAGRELERILSRGGVGRGECSTLNSHLCVRGKEEEGVGKLTKAVNLCRGRVERYLEEIQPKGILCLGGSAMRSIMPGFVRGAVSDGLMRHRGSLWSRQEVEAANRTIPGGESICIPSSVRYVMATIHPSAILQRKRIAGQQAMGYRMVPALDLKRLREGVERGRKIATARGVWGVPPWKGEDFVFDIETRSKEDRRIEWIGIQRVEDEGGDVYGGPWEMMREWMKGEMGKKGILKVGHNIIGFDLQAIEEDGITTIEGPFWDTMIAGGTCEGDMARGLFYWTSYLAGHKAMFHKELTRSGKEGDPYRDRRTIALRAAWKATGAAKGVTDTEGDWEWFYNMRDVITTGIVMRSQRERMKKEGWI